jgi:diguanylate cyclase (GGDEF)-like protein
VKILLVEDDLLSATVLSQLLVVSNFTVDTAANAKQAEQLIETYPYDLVILDVMLPDADGFSLCAKFRAKGYKMPVLLLTARDSTDDRVMGLEAGADDYVVKPYEVPELIARVRALLRRDRDILAQVLTWERLRVDLTTNLVTYDHESIRLTQKEYGILELFLRHPQQIFNRSVLLDRIWSAGEFPNEEAVTTHIKGLRQKLKAAGLPQDLIETIYGVGYRLRLAPTIATPPPAPPQTEPVPAIIQPDPEPAVIPAMTRVQATIARLTKELQANLAEPISILRQAAIALGEDSLDADLRYQGYLHSHRMVGALGSLGFAEGSAIARQIEQFYKTDAPLAPTDCDQLLQLVSDLEAKTCDTPTNLSLTKPASELEVTSNPNLAQFRSSKLPLMLIVDDDPIFVQQIQQEAETWGMRVQIAHDLAIARAKIEQETPDVILLDVIFYNPAENGLSLLDELAEKALKIPIVMMTSASDLRDRVMVARHGGCSFIEKPASAEEVLNEISRVLHQNQSDRAKVMVVDDDPISLKILRSLLERWELDVITLQNPQQFWQVLESTAPDLLILDFMMPGYSGVDLCRAVRTAALWHDLPIVFLSAQSDRESVRQLFAAGADDYLCKPVVEVDLQTRILSRLERSRLSKQIADFDGLTGVYTHRRGIQSLTQLLRLATRNKQTLCLAILDLDLFKQVNDRYGHGMGDAVLKQFGNFLRQFFRSEDVTMRWGGEEFVVGLYGADRQKSVARLNELLALWRQQKFVTLDRESFSVTFSAGVAEYPEDGVSLEILYRNMDIALYQAKATGRNRVVAVGDL